MAFEGVCPYFLRESDGYLYCELCRFCYPSKEARRDHVYKYCASVKGFEKCTVKAILDGEYERRSMQREQENQKKA